MAVLCFMFCLLKHKKNKIIAINILLKDKKTISGSIFSDDYRYIEELKQIKPEWNLYYLIDDKEKGYVNKDFQSLPWNEKRKKMIRYFAQMEMCLRSKMHLGYEYSCTNNYFRSFRNPSEYFAVVVNSGLSRKSYLETGL